MQQPDFSRYIWPDIDNNRLPVIGSASADADWRANGLVALFDCRQGRELISGDFASNITSFSALSKQGLTAGFASTGNQQYKSRPQYALTGAMAVVVFCDVGALTGFGALVSKEGSTTANIPYEFRVGVTSTDSWMSFIRASAASGAMVVSGSGNNIAAGAKSVVLIATAGTQFADGPRSIYVNGVVVANANSAISFPVTDTGAAVWIGRRSDGATQLTGSIYYVALLNRQPSAQEIELITASPATFFGVPQFASFIPSGTVTFNLTIAEAAAGIDSQGSALTAPIVISESGIAIDAISEGAIFGRAILETGSATDALNALYLVSATVTEIGSAVDTQSAAYLINAAISESVSATDSQSEGMTASVILSESGTAIDAVSGSVSGVLTIAEAASSADALTKALIAPLSITESGAALDAVTEATTMTVLVAEIASAQETVSNGSVFSKTIVEAGSAGETQGAVTAIAKSIAESGNAMDVVLENAILYTFIAEGVNAQDQLSTFSIFARQINESASMQDIIAIISGLKGNSRWYAKAVPRSYHATATMRNYKAKY